MDARLIGLASVVAATLAAGETPARAAAAPARVFAVDDGVRLRRSDTAGAIALGREISAGAGSGDIPLLALRGETVAVQLVVVADQAPIEQLKVALSPFSEGGADRPQAAIFRAHYLTVAARSRNDRHPGESLGWSAGARPPDAEVQGEVPDALIPIDLDPHPVLPGPEVPARQSSLFWIDVVVPAEAPAGPYRAAGTLTTGQGTLLSRFQIRLQVLPALLPYRATSVFIYYEPDRLDSRLGTRATAEPQLWQLLHAHHIDALPPLRGASDLARVHAALDGSLYRRPGPGPGVGVGVMALGAYGTLGAPGEESLARVEEMLPGLPAGGAEVFLYAIDENCRSPRAGEWSRALAGRPATAGRVRVAQTCNDPIDRQPVDVALFSADSFTRGLPGAARAVGRRAWIYNGFLPRTGTLLLDADPRGLTANGWIAAVMAIPRWFYWESTFWDDDNRGGRGAIDPFTTAESFHNADGDAALGDGLLLYPGRQTGRFAGRSLGADQLLPSIRLKFLRRGIQDAGLIALAARERPAETSAILARAIPAALDEARLDQPASWETAPQGLADGRAALRALITRPDAIAPAEIISIFDDLAARRRTLVPLAPTPRQIKVRRWLATAGIATAITIALLLARRAQTRRAVRPV